MNVRKQGLGKVYFWISHIQKCISFHEEKDYQYIKCLDVNDFKNQVYYYIDAGYKVQ